MIFFMYNLHYNGGNHIKDRSPDIIFHTQVYGIADIYDMQLLKDYAKKLFQDAAKEGWKTDDFSSAVQVAYTNVPSTDRGLRNTIINIAVDNASTLATQKDFKEALHNVPELAADLAIALAMKPNTYKFLLYHCPALCCPRRGKVIKFWTEIVADVKLACSACNGVSNKHVTLNLQVYVLIWDSNLVS